jgi:hypothetical protein
MHDRPAKLARAFLIVAASLIIIVPLAAAGGLFVFAHWPFNWPSDRSAAVLFEKHRPEFQKIVEMVREDRRTKVIPAYSVRIDPGWGNPGNVNSQTKKMSQQRFTEYVILFNKLGLRYGLTVGERETINFNIACIGTLVIGPCSYKGIVYKPDLRQPIIIGSLADADLPKGGTAVARGFYLKALARDWFIYRDEFD